MQYFFTMLDFPFSTKLFPLVWRCLTKRQQEHPVYHVVRDDMLSEMTAEIFLEMPQSKDGPVQNVPPGLNCTYMNTSLAFYLRLVNLYNYWPKLKAKVTILSRVTLNLTYCVWTCVSSGNTS